MIHAYLITALLTACAPDTTMTTEGYDKSCELPEDCEAVFVGEVCGCGCDMEAINGSEYEAYEVERAALMDMCRQEIPDCAACEDVEVSCVQGTCEVE